MDDVETALREHWGRLLALLMARFRDLDLAEESLGDAFAVAAQRWPVDGTPHNPPAWLLRVAQRKALDLLRARVTAQRKLPLLVADGHHHDEEAMVEALDWPDAARDDELRMILLCCHPALTREAQLALSLRLVLGLSTREIARLCLTSEPTMAARITRAKRKITAATLPFALPEPGRLAERVDGAVQTVYLTFTAGYAPGESATLSNLALANEALRLGHLLVEVAPHLSAPRALLALMLLHHARRDARVDADGSLVLLPDQDRSRWRTDEIAKGFRLLSELTPDTRLAVELALQASIAWCHDQASTADDTDWRQIADLYRQLEALTGNPVVRLNRAVAVAEADGPQAGLALLAGLDAALPRSHRLPAVRAELLFRSGHPAKALPHQKRALELCSNAAEHDHLRRRLDAISNHLT